MHKVYSEKSTFSLSQQNLSNHGLTQATIQISAYANFLSDDSFHLRLDNSKEPWVHNEVLNIPEPETYNLAPIPISEIKIKQMY